MKKLLVTGINGFLGWNVGQLAKKKWTLFGTVWSHPIEIPHAKVIRINLTNYKELKRLFQQICPDVVLHTAAITDPNYCQEYRSESHKINVETSNNIAGLCADLEIPCLFTSSDLVFNGKNPPYDEESQVSPVSFYGEQKAIAEVGMKERYANTIICRMPLMFGDPGPIAKSFIQPMITAIMSGHRLNLFVDEFRTPVGGASAAEGILFALGGVTKGILHLGGRERISRYEFGKLLAEILEVRNPELIPCKQIDVPMSAPRPSDVSLDSSQAFSMGYNPLSISEELRLICPAAEK